MKKKQIVKASEWNTWLEDMGDALLLYARMQTRSEEDAKDVLQDALIQLVKAVNSGSFQGDRSQWKSYTYTAIRHLAMDRGRRETIRSNYAKRQQETLTEGAEETPWLSSDADYDYLREKVEYLLRVLPSEMAEVVTLKIWGEYTFREIAEITKTNLSTVASRYRYAMESLRKELAINPIEL